MAARELHWWRHRRAHASAIERVPLIAAGSRPAVVIAGRPAAEWAADAGAGRIEILSWSSSRSKTTYDLAELSERAHTPHYYGLVRMHKSLEPSAALGRSAAGRRGKASLFLRSVPGPAVLCFLMLFSASAPSFWDGDSMEYLR